MISATNPESGTISFRYDSGGNLIEKTDARGISTIHTYDALNRTVFRDYSDSTPDITFSYDDPSVPFSKGKLTASASGESICVRFAFDPDGRVTHGRQRTDGLNYDFHYSYNAGGSLVSQTMPSGKIVAYDYDETGQITRVSNGRDE
ncbi:MAG: hypothetical protein IPK58_15550 [Acidobacteria bacterium]|nr:hypothetical protein [Acidobacteriota bacterium]